MSIRWKMIMVILPLVIVSLFLTSAASYFAAINGVTRLARESLGYKVYELEKYADAQWQLLEKYDYTNNPDMLFAAKLAVFIYASSIVQDKDKELILAINEQTGDIDWTTQDNDIQISPDDKIKLLSQIQDGREKLMETVIDGKERMFRSFLSPYFHRYILLTVEKNFFFDDVNKITVRTFVFTAGAIIVTVFVLILLSGKLTYPLRYAVNTIKKITQSPASANREERTVPVLYNDETGELADAFNVMITKLDNTRQKFQQYVPVEVIRQYVDTEGQMLKAERKKVAVLFSDIRGFTSLSNKKTPDELIKNLNSYFSGQVDAILSHNGIVDKFIGDAIMAFWEEKEGLEDPALRAVRAALAMLEELKKYNKNQEETGNETFRIGIGINYGEVMIGNIGSEQKLNYTVMGNTVNIAERIEGLTKEFGKEILVSEDVYLRIREIIPLQFVDTAQVQGIAEGIKIWTV